MAKKYPSDFRWVVFWLFICFSFCNAVCQCCEFFQTQSFTADAFIPAKALQDFCQFFFAKAQIAQIEQAVHQGLSEAISQYPNRKFILNFLSSITLYFL